MATKLGSVAGRQNLRRRLARDVNFQLRTGWMGKNFRGVRTQVQSETSLLLESGRALKMDTRQSAIHATKKIADSGRRDYPVASSKTAFWLYRGDCLDGAQWIHAKINENVKNPRKVVILDLADPEVPAGGHDVGSGSQEASICRRSNLLECLKHVPYPLGDLEAVYVPNLWVFRQSEERRYVTQPPVLLSSVAIAAADKPAITNEGHLTQTTREQTRRKIETICDVCLANGHTTLVICAFGCGGRLNPPSEIAGLFRDTLTGERFGGRFENVMVAIFDDHYGENYRPFAEVFRKLPNCVELSVSEPTDDSVMSSTAPALTAGSVNSNHAWKRPLTAQMPAKIERKKPRERPWVARMKERAAKKRLEKADGKGQSTPKNKNNVLSQRVGGNVTQPWKPRLTPKKNPKASSRPTPTVNSKGIRIPGA